VNRQSGVGDSKYVFSRDPLLTDHVIRRMRSAIFTGKMAYAYYFYHFRTGRALNFKLGIHRRSRKTRIAVMDHHQQSQRSRSRCHAVRLRNTCQTHRVTSRPWPLTLLMMVHHGDTGLPAPSVYQVWSSKPFPFGRYDALPVSALVGLVTLTFDLETAAHYCPWGVQPSYQFRCI